jgi:Heat shock transcription factor
MKNSSGKKKEELSAAEALTSLCKSPSTSPLCSSVTQTIRQEDRESSPFLLPSTACSLSNVPMPPLTSTSNIQKDDHASSTVKDKSFVTKQNFPQKLFDILDNPEHKDILKWLPGGKAFIIMDKKRFTAEILPVYFKQTQYTSFTRKLSRWKFARVPRGPYLGAYFHKLFRKDHKALCRLMSCNNEIPSLAVIAQVRQEAMESSSAAPSRRNVSPASMNLSLPQQTFLQNLEEMNKIALLKEQILQIRLQRAQLYERQKRILMEYGCEPFPKSNSDATNHPQTLLPTHLFPSAVYHNNSQQNHILNPQTITMMQMAKLRQMEMLNTALSTNSAQLQSFMTPQQQSQQGGTASGEFTVQQSRNVWGGKNCFRASAA